MKLQKINITQFNRKKDFPGSIEILFESIRQNFDDSVNVRLFTPNYKSEGLINRLKIILECSKKQNEINHITGDIHFASLLMNKKKTILTIHDCISIVRSKGIKKAILKFFWLTLPLKKVNFITVISQKTKDELLSLVDFPEDKIVIIPDCINSDFKFEKKETFNKLNPRILQIGTKVNKNIIRLAEALKGIPCTLDIVGKLSAKQIEALNSNDIKYENSFNISNDELIEKYKLCDIVAFISTYEGFGMPTLEAQTIGRPILTSNISPMKEIADKGACLVDPYDIENIRNGILKIIENDIFRNNIISCGIENVKNYSPEIVAKMYSDLYHKLSKEI